MLIYSVRHGMEGQHGPRPQAVREPKLWWRLEVVEGHSRVVLFVEAGALGTRFALHLLVILVVARD